MTIFANNHRNKILSSCIFLMLGLTFAVKAMLPAGFMPVFNGQGHIEIVICSGAGTKTVSVPAEDGNSPSSLHDKQASEVCDYQILLSSPVIPSSLGFDRALPALSLLKAALPERSGVPITVAYSFVARGPPSV